MDTTAITLTDNDNTLRDDQKQLLLAHANGLTNHEIAKQLGGDMRTVNQLNLDLQRALDARSMPHAIATAFVRGVLSVGRACRTLDAEIITKNLCALLVVITCCQHLDDSMRLRVRVSRRGESTTYSRTKEI